MWEVKIAGEYIKLSGDNKIVRNYESTITIPDCSREMVRFHTGRFADKHLAKDSELGESFYKIRTMDIVSMVQTDEELDLNVDNVYEADNHSVELLATLLDTMDVSSKFGDRVVQRKKLAYYYLSFIGLMEVGVSVDTYLREFENEPISILSSEIYAKKKELAAESDDVERKRKLSTLKGHKSGKVSKKIEKEEDSLPSNKVIYGKKAKPDAEDFV